MQHGAVIILFAIMIIAVGAGTFVSKTMIDTKDRVIYFSDEQVKYTISNYIDIEEVMGRGTGKGYVEYLYISSKLRPGSDPLHFNMTLLQAVANGESEFYNYNSLINCSLNPYYDNSNSSISHSGNSQSYGVKFYIQIEGDEHSMDFITQGDYVVFCIPLAGRLGGGEELRIGIIAEHAGKKVLEFKTKDVLAGELVTLYHKLV